MKPDPSNSKWILLYPLIVGILCLVMAECCGGGPTLYIVESQTCPPCIKFQRDYKADASLRNALHGAFEVRGLQWEVPVQRNHAQRLGVTTVPSFVVIRNGRKEAHVIGYKDPSTLCVGLGIKVSPVPSVPRSDPGLTPPRESEESQRMRDRIRELNKRLTDEQTDSAEQKSFWEAERARLQSIMREQERSFREEIERQRAATEEALRKIQEGGVTTPSVPLPGNSQVTPDKAGTGLPLSEEDKPNTTVQSTIQTPATPTVSSPAILDGLVDYLPLILGLAGAGTGAGLAIPIGAKVLKWMFSGKKGERVVQSSSADFLPGRDKTEVEQILSLRQQESRDPVHDSLFGVFFEDEAANSPDKSVQEAWRDAQVRFNQIAPLSSQTNDTSITMRSS